MSAPPSPGLTEELPCIVVVEDNVESNNLLRDWLRPRFQVKCFFDAESALRQLKSHPSRDPMVFLIDYNLPGENGLVLKEKLAALFPAGKFILASGLFDAKLTAQARTAGFHALLPKPFGMPSVTQKIESLCGLQQRESLSGMVRRQTGQLPELIK